MVIPNFTPRFTDVLEGFAGLTSHYSQTTVYYSKGIKSRINKGKRYIRQKLEDTRYKLPRVLSQWSHTGHTKSPRMNCRNTCKMFSAREVCLSLKVQGIHWGNCSADCSY